jgi:hypothetical protein
MDQKRNWVEIVKMARPTMPPNELEPSTRSTIAVVRNQRMLLPAWFARLAGVALVVIASTASAAGTATAAGTSTARTSTATGSAGTAVGFGTRLVDIQCAAAEFFSVQRCNGFLGFAGIRHFDKCKSPRTAGVTIGDQADLIDFAVRLKQGTQFRFRGAVREVANKKLLHGFPFPGEPTQDVRFSSAG